jgi:hypothetical protein
VTTLNEVVVTSSNPSSLLLCGHIKKKKKKPPKLPTSHNLAPPLRRKVKMDGIRQNDVVLDCRVTKMPFLEEKKSN